MSVILLEFTKSFLKKRLEHQEFVNSYIELWKIERDLNLLKQDEDNLSECLSNIFCLADLYNPDNEREEYEIDKPKLFSEVGKTIKKYEDEKEKS